MTPEQIREEAIERIVIGTYSESREDVDPEWADTEDEAREAKDATREWAARIVDFLGDLLPLGGIRYAVAHPVLKSEARFVGFTLEECKEFATKYETHVIEQHLTEWTTHE
jgi:hypothetical protein